MENHPEIRKELCFAKQAFCQEPSEENYDALFAVFARFVEENAWISLPVKQEEQGLALEIVTHQEKEYFAMYAGPNSNTAQGTTACMDINRLIDAVYDDPLAAGIVIDPYDAPLFIGRKQIHQQTLRKDPRLQSKDWGPGIPVYQESDLMTGEEILDFAMEIVTEFGLEKDGYEILESHNGLNDMPNFVAQKNGQLYFIVVEADMEPNMPAIRPDKERRILEHAAQFHAVALYAAVSFTSADTTRSYLSLALCGDNFHARFLGLSRLGS